MMGDGELDLRGPLRVLVDRHQILDCIHRNARGLDRHDAELVLSTYHADATDDHGTFAGTATEFVDWILPYQRERFTAMQHHITTHTCELDGDVAHAETYMLFAAENVDGTPLTVSGARYVDRFERRDGVWAIADRKVVFEWKGGLTDVDAANQPTRTPVGNIARDRSDLSYLRAAVHR